MPDRQKSDRKHFELSDESGCENGILEMDSSQGSWSSLNCFDFDKANKKNLDYISKERCLGRRLTMVRGKNGYQISKMKKTKIWEKNRDFHDAAQNKHKHCNHDHDEPLVGKISFDEDKPNARKVSISSESEERAISRSDNEIANDKIEANFSEKVGNKKDDHHLKYNKIDVAEGATSDEERATSYPILNLSQNEQFERYPTDNSEKRMDDHFKNLTFKSKSRNSRDKLSYNRAAQNEMIPKKTALPTTDKIRRRLSSSIMHLAEKIEPVADHEIQSVNEKIDDTHKKSSLDDYSIDSKQNSYPQPRAFIIQKETIHKNKHANTIDSDKELRRVINTLINTDGRNRQTFDPSGHSKDDHESNIEDPSSSSDPIFQTKKKMYVNPATVDNEIDINYKDIGENGKKRHWVSSKLRHLAKRIQPKDSNIQRLKELSRTSFDNGSNTRLRGHSKDLTEQNLHSYSLLSNKQSETTDESEDNHKEKSGKKRRWMSTKIRHLAERIQQSADSAQQVEPKQNLKDKSFESYREYGPRAKTEEQNYFNLQNVSNDAKTVHESGRRESGTARRWISSKMLHLADRIEPSAHDNKLDNKLKSGIEELDSSRKTSTHSSTRVGNEQSFPLKTNNQKRRIDRTKDDFQKNVKWVKSKLKHLTEQIKNHGSKPDDEKENGLDGDSLSQKIPDNKNHKHLKTVKRTFVLQPDSSDENANADQTKLGKEKQIKTKLNRFVDQIETHVQPELVDKNKTLVTVEVPVDEQKRLQSEQDLLLQPPTSDNQNADLPSNDQVTNIEILQPGKNRKMVKISINPSRSSFSNAKQEHFQSVENKETQQENEFDSHSDLNRVRANQRNKQRVENVKQSENGAYPKESLKTSEKDYSLKYDHQTREFVDVPSTSTATNKGHNGHITGKTSHTSNEHVNEFLINKDETGTYPRARTNWNYNVPPVKRKDRAERTSPRNWGANLRPVERQNRVKDERTFAHDWGVNLRPVEKISKTESDKTVAYDWGVNLRPVEQESKDEEKTFAHDWGVALRPVAVVDEDNSGDSRRERRPEDDEHRGNSVKPLYLIHNKNKTVLYEPTSQVDVAQQPSRRSSSRWSRALSRLARVVRFFRPNENDDKDPRPKGWKDNSVYISKYDPSIQEPRPLQRTKRGVKPAARFGPEVYLRERFR